MKYFGKVVAYIKNQGILSWLSHLSKLEHAQREEDVQFDYSFIYKGTMLA